MPPIGMIQLFYLYNVLRLWCNLEFYVMFPVLTLSMSVGRISFIIKKPYYGVKGFPWRRLCCMTWYKFCSGRKPCQKCFIPSQKILTRHISSCDFFTPPSPGFWKWRQKGGVMFDCWPCSLCEGPEARFVVPTAAETSDLNFRVNSHTVMIV